MSTKLLSIIIPVYNEERTLGALLGRVLAAPLTVEREVVLVDDGSTDRSAGIIHEWVTAHPGVRHLVLGQTNQGKGAAVRAGIRASQGDIVIVQDADLEYNPDDYQACIGPILEGRAMVVYGSRELGQDRQRHSSRAFYLGGLAVSCWFNILYGSRLTDEPTCYKVFAGDLIRALPFHGNGFEWEPEVTGKLLRLGLEIAEVPIRYTPRTVGEGKKIRWTDGVLALWEALRWRFKSVETERRAVAAWLGSGSRPGVGP